MPDILSFGSLNLDNVFTVDHFVRPGETISSHKFEIFPGGKGLNQSIALALAGGKVYHAGNAGADGEMLISTLREKGVNTDLIDTSGSAAGRAIIQVDSIGLNCILLHSGANAEITKEYAESVLSRFKEGDLLVLQNEINMLEFIVDKAYSKGMLIALNPSPINDQILKIDLNKISWLLLNEIEGKGLTGKRAPEDILDDLISRYPRIKIVLTLGEDGSCYRDAENEYRQGIYQADVVDTTAAGDTFAGYFLSSITNGYPVQTALKMSAMASSMAVSKKGAAMSIPELSDVIKQVELYEV